MGYKKKPRRTAFVLLLLLLATYPIFRTTQPVETSFPTPIFTSPSLPSPPLNGSKVALLIDNRPLPVIIPIILHMMSVLPPDWSFQFVGSQASINLLHSSSAMRHRLASHKLSTTLIPANATVAGQEAISAFMTTLWLWETVLGAAEWVLVFQTDSILCAKAQHTIDDFLSYDWIGAPWRKKNRIGGNGGLSLRRVAPLIEILRQEQREPNGAFEDVWFTERLQKMPGARIANRTTALTFSGEGQVPDALLEEVEQAKAEGKPDPRARFEPMGYHIGYSGKQYAPNLWGTPELRKHVWEYCPEVKLLFPEIDAAEYVVGDCGASWKRDGAAQEERELAFFDSLVPW